MPRVSYLKSKNEKRVDVLENQKRVFKREIHGVVAKIRTDYNLTQDGFAEQTGINRGTLSNRLKNPTKLSVEEILKIKNRFPLIAADIAKFLTS